MTALAILQLCFEYMSESTLEDNMNVSNLSSVVILYILMGNNIDRFGVKLDIFPFNSFR